MRKKRTSLLREILSRLPEDIEANKISVLPEIGPALYDLYDKGFIWLNCQAGSGNCSGGPDIPSPDDENVKKEGAEITLEPCEPTSKWQWELIKRGIKRLGFRHSGLGQKDWHLHLWTHEQWENL